MKQKHSFQNLLRWKFVSLFGFAGTAAFLAYVVILKTTGDARMDDGTLTGGEMNFIEFVSSTAVMSALGVSWVFALIQTFRLDLKGWFFGVFLFFPITPIYFWVTEEKTR